jgi:hypothetical protein
MTDRPSPESQVDMPESDLQVTTSPPRWVKAFGIAALVLVLLIVLMLVIGGNHGPGRHMG